MSTPEAAWGRSVACNALWGGLPDRYVECDVTVSCHQPFGHQGVHTSSLPVCNRPKGHDGPHLVIRSDTAERLATWGQRSELKEAP